MQPPAACVSFRLVLCCEPCGFGSLFSALFFELFSLSFGGSLRLVLSSHSKNSLSLRLCTRRPHYIISNDKTGMESIPMQVLLPLMPLPTLRSRAPRMSSADSLYRASSDNRGEPPFGLPDEVDRLSLRQNSSHSGCMASTGLSQCESILDQS